MCGIFAAIKPEMSTAALMSYFLKIQHRGPDNSDYKIINPDLHLGFHRLAVNGLDVMSNQPMYWDDCWLIANAEIFNYRELASTYAINLKTQSDCEIIIPLYRKIGLVAMLKSLDAEFAFVLYDARKDKIFAARDHLGIRGMYIGHINDQYYIASEAKALVFSNELSQFPTGCWWSYDRPDHFNSYYTHDYELHRTQDEEVILDDIRKLLTNAVQKRLMSDRPVGCLLSGGLDSSLISAIVAKLYHEPLETFSIGMEGSPDLINAQNVADHIGSKHHSVLCTEQDFIDTLDETIYITGSYDVTTIRASVGHILISRYVRDHSDVKVLFTGETIDEMGSYLYFQNAPSPEDFQAECIRLLKDIHYFDMLRGDRSISCAGIEARVPFSDKAFVRFFMGIDPIRRQFDGQRIEKYLLRKAFEGENLIPSDVLWRRKNGFSDSVSHQNRSWSVVIQEHVDKSISDDEYNRNKLYYKQNAPKSKEAYYYRKKYHEFYGHHELTPYQWLPKWCGDITDPSARVLTIYAAD